MFEGLLAGFFNSPFAIPIVGIVVGVGVPVIAYYWFELEKHKSNNDLKRSMVERGMSADEIERILAAGSTEDREEHNSKSLIGKGEPGAKENWRC